MDGAGWVVVAAVDGGMWRSLFCASSKVDCSLIDLCVLRFVLCMHWPHAMHLIV
jgi:hypothetical protein